ncbi:MAG: ferritin family protein [bacterium]
MDIKKTIEAMRIGIQTELNGIQFYQLAAERTRDEKGKAVFTLLAKDELKHFKELQKHYQSLISSNKWAPAINIGEAKAIFEGESPIFSEELKGRAKETHFEMSALSIGALLESNSIDFYKKMIDEISDPIGKELFIKLWKWEQGHLEAITKQLDLLKEEYWAEQNFSPLF